MQLKEFIAESLKQIIEGVKTAQEVTDGDNVNARGANVPSGTNVYSAGTYGTFTIVDFDVAVSAETQGKGGANLTVFGFGIEGGGAHTVGSANRITFSVPVRLPDGDTSRADRIDRRAEMHADLHSGGFTGR